jgi:pilus assembly protein Flp/PilA
VRRFAADPSGATAIEYSLIATLIGAVIITALTTMGTQINVMISSVIPALQ